MPNSGFLVASHCWITGTAYAPVAAGSPGPFDRNRPSGCVGHDVFEGRGGGNDGYVAARIGQVAEDIAFDAVIDGDDFRFLFLLSPSHERRGGI